MLFLLVEVERMLQFVAEALTIRRLGVTAMLFLVDIASTAPLCLGQPFFL
jgi:hypothetical protein